MQFRIFSVEREPEIGEEFDFMLESVDAKVSEVSFPDDTPPKMA